MCSVVLTVTRLKFFEVFFDRCARSLQRFENNQAAAERRLCRRSCWLRNGSRTRTCGWSCFVFTEGAALRKMRNNAFFSGDCYERKIGRSSIFELVHRFWGRNIFWWMWRKFCYLFFFLRHKEWVYQACLVRERLRRRNNAALLTSAVAKKPLREEATFTYKDSSRKSRHCRTNWAS